MPANRVGRALFIFDYTGIMAKPWLDAGYECVLIDGQHEIGLHRDKDNPLLVRYGMWIDPKNWMKGAARIMSIFSEADFVFGFPECTDLAVSGAKHFERKRKENPLFQYQAADMAKLVAMIGEYNKCPYGIENPVSVLSTLWRKPDYTFHPCEYGGYLPEDDVHPLYPDYIAPRDAYPKKTCLWVGNGFTIPEKRPVPCPEGYSTQHKKLGGRSLKTKNIRSATPRGFAQAVFEANHKQKD